MTRTFVAKGMEIVQHDKQQILLRGKGDGSFADIVNKESKWLCGACILDCLRESQTTLLIKEETT